MSTTFYNKKLRCYYYIIILYYGLLYKRLLYSVHSFISDHITIYNCCYLLLLCKTWIKTKENIAMLAI